MFEHTDKEMCRWHVVPSDDKKKARLNCISHFLTTIAYEDVLPTAPVNFPPRQANEAYVRPPVSAQCFVPERY